MIGCPLRLYKCKFCRRVRVKIGHVQLERLNLNVRSKTEMISLTIKSKLGLEKYCRSPQDNHDIHSESVLRH